MRKLLALSAIAFLGATSTAQAHTDRYTAAKHRYTHAVSVVKWIGAHAATTQYHPDARIKHRWQKAVRFWNQVKKKQWAIMHPKPRIAGFPPHHRLWVCISRYEGSPTSVNPNGHYGMLQMTWNWMNLIRGAASNYPQAVQEWAAERAWAANGYSWSFLNDQWYRYDAADGCGTTG